MSILSVSLVIVEKWSDMVNLIAREAAAMKSMEPELTFIVIPYTIEEELSKEEKDEGKTY